MWMYVLRGYRGDHLAALAECGPDEALIEAIEEYTRKYDRVDVSRVWRETE